MRALKKLNVPFKFVKVVVGKLLWSWCVMFRCWDYRQIKWDLSKGSYGNSAFIE